MDLQLTGSKVLVTGSTRGIGFGIAEAFVRERADVMLCGRSAESLQEALTHFRREFPHGQVRGLSGDLLDGKFCNALSEHVADVWKKVDCLILNFGSGKSVGGLTASHSEWMRMYHLNVVTACELLQSFVPLLRQGDVRSVVFIGSIAGLEFVSAPPAYAAAKAALLKVAKDFSVLLAPDSIRVNIICPGNIMFQGSTWETKAKAQPEAVQAMLDRDVPLKRFGTPAEIGHAATFLASRVSSFTTGACLIVDGGQTRGAI